MCLGNIVDVERRMVPNYETRYSQMHDQATKLSSAEPSILVTSV